VRPPDTKPKSVPAGRWKTVLLDLSRIGQIVFPWVGEEGHPQVVIALYRQ
jgi:hypothetical protein